MPSCVFNKCTNYDSKINKSGGISYHKFPTDEVRCADWVAIVREQRKDLDWMPSRSSRICSNHFKTTDKYESNKGRIMLKNEAVPFIQLTNHIKTWASSSSLDEFIIPEIVMEEREEIILESPRRAALKNRVLDLTYKGKMLQKKNKILNQQNKRLKKKLVSVTSILKELKNALLKKNVSEEHFAHLDIKPEVLDLLNKIH